VAGYISKGADFAELAELIKKVVGQNPPKA